MPAKQLIIALDPGTGSSSPTGFSVFNPHTLEIFYAANIDTRKGLLQHRIKDISDKLSATLDEIDRNFADHELIICIEQFVMMGKGGETLQRLIGSFMGRLPYRARLTHVQNTKVKLFVAGHGHADKDAVGFGVLRYFEGNQESAAVIKRLQMQNEPDIIDSLAIGVTGWLMQNHYEAPKKPKAKRAPKQK